MFCIYYFYKWIKSLINKKSLINNFYLMNWNVISVIYYPPAVRTRAPSHSKSPNKTKPYQEKNTIFET